MPKVLVPLAEGFEELEAITVTDLLRRAKVDVTIAGLKPGPVRGSRGAVILPDTALDDALGHAYDMIVLPGGLPGAVHLGEDARVTGLLRNMAAAGKFTCAICAAPKVLAEQGLLDGKRMTAYPGVVSDTAFPALRQTGAAVERDGQVITSRGPGTAMDFALALIDALCGKETRDSVEAGLVRG
jgi:4-methyl-5(b-hydroxyethyl)-thiazole monophosphate biosynthesis